MFSPLAKRGQVGWLEQDAGIFLVALLDFSITSSTGRSPLRSQTPAMFLPGKAATAASPDVVLAKQRPLRSGKNLKHLSHRRLASDGIVHYTNSLRTWWTFDARSTRPRCCKISSPAPWPGRRAWPGAAGCSDDRHAAQSPFGRPSWRVSAWASGRTKLTTAERPSLGPNNRMPWISANCSQARLAKRWSCSKMASSMLSR